MLDAKPADASFLTSYPTGDAVRPILLKKALSLNWALRTQTDNAYTTHEMDRLSL